MIYISREKREYAVFAFCYLYEKGYTIEIQDRETHLFFTERIQCVSFYNAEEDGNKALVFDCKSEIDALAHALYPKAAEVAINELQATERFHEKNLLRCITYSAQKALIESIGEEEFALLMEAIQKKFGSPKVDAL